MFGQPSYNVYQQPMYNQPMMQEPMMRPQFQPTAFQPQAQPQNNGQSMIWVPNAQAANDFIVAPNNAVTLWDMNSPVVYVKKTDASGKPTMTTYDLVERVQGAAPQTAERIEADTEYVTRKEFDELAARVAAMNVKPVRKVKEADNESSV